MKYVTIFSCMLITFLSAAAFPSDAVVTIGTKAVSRNELLDNLPDASHDPMIAVTRIKREQAINRLASARNLKGSNPEKLIYRDMFHASLDEDRLIRNDHILPHAAKQKALIRKTLFDRWLAEMADKLVPVHFTDPEAFWELVKNSESYRIRKESGYEPSMDSWSYTCHELLVPPDMMIAQKNGDTYVNGSELNVWIENNYAGSIKPYAKRKHSREEILSVLARKATEGKLMSKYVALKNLSIKQDLRKMALDRLVKRNMMNTRLKIGRIEGDNISEVLVGIEKKYAAAQAKKIKRMRHLLSGDEPSESFDGAEPILLANAAVGAMQREIIEEIDDDEVYDWMKSTGFRGNLNEGRQTLGIQKYKEYIDSELEMNGIDIIAFNKEK